MGCNMRYENKRNMQISSNHISHPQLTPKEGAYKGCKPSNGKRSITTPTHNNAPITCYCGVDGAVCYVGHRADEMEGPTSSCRISCLSSYSLHSFSALYNHSYRILQKSETLHVAILMINQQHVVVSSSPYLSWLWKTQQ